MPFDLLPAKALDLALSDMYSLQKHVEPVTARMNSCRFGVNTVALANEGFSSPFGACQTCGRLLFALVQPPCPHLRSFRILVREQVGEGADVAVVIALASLAVALLSPF